MPGTPPLNEATRIAFTAPQLWAIGAILCIGMFAFTTAWVNNSNRLDRLESKIDAMNSVRWTTEDQREFAHRMARDNTGKIVVPDSDAIRRDLRTQ